MSEVEGKDPKEVERQPEAEKSRIRDELRKKNQGKPKEIWI